MIKPLVCGSAILAVLMFCECTGTLCAEESPTKAQLREVIQQIIDEEARSNIECEISRLDLDSDGTDEALFRFPVGAHGSQARVIKWAQGKEQVIFDEGCDAPTASFVRINGTPAVALEFSDYEPSYVNSTRTQKLYVWNGKQFAYAPSYDCVLKHEVSHENGRELHGNTAGHCLPKRDPIASTPCSTLNQREALVGR